MGRDSLSEGNNRKDWLLAIGIIIWGFLGMALGEILVRDPFMGTFVAMAILGLGVVLYSEYKSQEEDLDS